MNTPTKIDAALADIEWTAGFLSENDYRQTANDLSDAAAPLAQHITQHIAAQDAEIARLKNALAHQNADSFAWDGHTVHGDKTSVAALVAFFKDQAHDRQDDAGVAASWGAWCGSRDH